MTRPRTLVPIANRRPGDIVRMTFGWPFTLYFNIWELAQRNERTFRTQAIIVLKAGLAALAGEEGTHGTSPPMP